MDKESEKYYKKAIKIREVISGMEYREGIALITGFLDLIIEEIDDDEEKKKCYEIVFSTLMEGASQYITQEDVGSSINELRKIIDLIDSEPEGRTH